MFEHSKISPHTLTSLKRVPRCVADRLHRRCRQTTGGSGDGRAHGGDPSSSVCEECLAAFERKEQRREELRNDKREFDRLLTVRTLDNTAVIGKRTLKTWHVPAMKLIDGKGGEDFKLNSDAVCGHGFQKEVRCTRIPAPAWAIVLKYHVDVYHLGSTPDGAAAGGTGEAAKCQSCSNEKDERDDLEALVRGRAAVFKSNLGNFLANKGRPDDFYFADKTAHKFCSSRFYVVPRAFHRELKSFVHDPVRYAGKHDVTDVSELDLSVDNSVFLCARHQRLQYDLHGVVKREQKCDEPMVVVDDENDGNGESPKPILLWETEWKFIKENFLVDHCIYIRKPNSLDCAVVLNKCDDVVVGAAATTVPETSKAKLETSVVSAPRGRLDVLILPVVENKEDGDGLDEQEEQDDQLEYR